MLSMLAWLVKWAKVVLLCGFPRVKLVIILMDFLSMSYLIRFRDLRFDTCGIG